MTANQNLNVITVSGNNIYIYNNNNNCPLICSNFKFVALFENFGFGLAVALLRSTPTKPKPKFLSKRFLGGAKPVVSRV